LRGKLAEKESADVRNALLLVLAAFGTFMVVLMAVSLRCWTSEVPRGSATTTDTAAADHPAEVREAA